MRTIVKRAEPATLTTHRNTPQSDYGNYADKDTLRSALVAEQRGLCCYCMCRIEDEPSAMKIEHCRSRTMYRGEQLVYRNLLAACPGGEGQPLQLQHCDTRKGDRDLLWNPADPERRIEERIGYALDGAIRSDDPAFDRQLNDVLNLNLSRIRNERQGSLDGVLDWWRAQRRPVPTQRLEREVERRNSPEQLAPYVQVAVWWLERKLRQRARRAN
jgi:uncharacterized protein (TIGR02646 family)